MDFLLSSNQELVYQSLFYLSSCFFMFLIANLMSKKSRLNSFASSCLVVIELGLITISLKLVEYEKNYVGEQTIAILSLMVNLVVTILSLNVGR